MSGVGFPEAIVALLLILIVVFPFWFAVKCRAKWPGKVWLGLLLALFNPVAAQWYPDDGQSLRWVIGLVCIVVVLMAITLNDIAFAAGELTAMGIIWYRLTS